MHLGPLTATLAALVALAALGTGATHPKASAATTPPPAAVPLFPKDGPPAGWTVRNWADVSQEPPPGAQWLVTDGILRGSTPRGTWLVSDLEYSDFILEYEFRLAERGNSGFAFRFPKAGDPAVAGLELQMVDPRFYGTNYTAEAWELTGSLHKGLAPFEQTFLPLDWNLCVVHCTGPKITVTLNGRKVIDADLDRQTATLPKGLPLAQRPRRGHIGFQELSRAGGLVEIRNARIRTLDPTP